MANKNKKSSKPSGLTITRNGSNFVCEWKIPSSKYGDGQQFKATTVKAVDITKTLTKKTVKINLSDRYPNGKKLTAFSFSVRGNTDKKKNDNQGWSDWATKELTLNKPRKPSIVTELTGTNKCKFTWSVADTGANSAYPFARVRIQTKLVKDCTWDPKDDNWKNATEETSSSASSYKEYTENSGTLATGNYTRLVRIQSQGCAGDSDWAYAKHVYGSSKQANQKKGTVKDTSAGYDVQVNWNTAWDKSTPIDESVVEWVMTAPASDMSCPSGLSWTEGATIKDTIGEESVHLSIDATLAEDQCLFTRINTKHDSNITYGAPRLQKVGVLKSPTGLAVEDVDPAAQTAKITATNASTVPGTEIEIIYRKNGSETIVGVIDGSPNFKTVKCPKWEDTDVVSFGVRAVLPKSTTTKTTDGVTIYTIKPHMTSEVVWQSGSVATAPTGLALDRVDGDVRATWENNWSDANMIELSWSDNQNAWESTNAPETFTIENPFATSWRIAELATGRTWYVRVRAVHDSGDGKTYSPYSQMKAINLSSSPSIPTLTLSQGVVATGQGFTAAWEYESTDGTPQSEARIYKFNGGTSYTELGRTKTEEYIDLPGWSTAGTYLICVEVISGSGQSSGKSDVVAITVAPAVTCSMVNSLQNKTITDDDESTRTVRALQTLPLTITVTGAGTGGTTSVVITRAEDYHVERPDGSDQNGNEGETIVSITQTGESSISIGLGDLIGTLDDGAKYILTAIVTDSIGQVAEVSESFEVHWSDQAVAPAGEYMIDREDNVAIINVIEPDEASPYATCDIYRLSADKPELIFKGAEFGESYVDPYPAFGSSAGYRLVYITKCGDYNTAENVLAFYDMFDEQIDGLTTIIDFDGEQIELAYDLKFSSQWEKDFITRKHLGGSIRGYWMKGVQRKGSITAVHIPDDEEDLIEAMRRLSEYEGECHVRTPEGSSFKADIQVSESWDDGRETVSFTINVTRTEPTGQDGMTLSTWEGER